jgi:hypothetical protein
VFERPDSDLTHIEAAVDRMAILLEDSPELSRIGRLVNPSEEIAP